MKSRFWYFLQLVGKLGVLGYVLIGVTVLSAIVGAMGAPEIVIPAYIVIGLIIWFVVLRRFVEAERLKDIGLDGEATVLSIAENGTSIQINGAVPKPGVTMQLEVRVTGKAPYQAQVKTFISPFELTKFHPGNVIAVKVDPEKAENLIVSEGTPLTKNFHTSL